MERKLILEYILPKEFKISTNQVYAGIHWRKRQRHADFFHRLVLADCIEYGKQIEGKIDIYFEFRFKGRYLDSSNCSYMAKMIEDGLRKGGILKDDTNQFVGKFIIESILIPEKERKKMTNDTITVFLYEI